jgi:hypothetical protein
LTNGPKADPSRNIALGDSLSAEPKFPKEGIIKYNLACYSCQTGDIETAKNYLKKAFEIDSSWRLDVLNDEDLKPVWDAL